MPKFQCNAGVDSSVDIGKSLTLSGVASGGFLPYTYTWKFGDGQTGTGQNIGHIYTTTGTYTVILTVKDGHGRVVSDSLLVTVTPPSVSSLLHSSDVTYLGAFRLPSPTTGTYFGFTQGFIALDPNDNNLFVICKSSEEGGQSRVCKVSIPTPVLGSDINLFNRATLVQPGTDIFSNVMVAPYDNISGLHVYEDKLLWTISIYYDAANQSTASHCYCPRTLGPSSGPFRLDNNIYPQKLAGYMTSVPSEYQATFGKVLTGRSGGNIITTSNDGPAAYGFDPSLLGSTQTVLEKISYDVGELDPNSHTSGAGPNLIWNWASTGVGSFFHNKTLGFVVSRGKGVYWYGDGEGVGDGCSSSNPGPDCYPGAVTDPYGGHGTHAPPYVPSLYLYNSDDLFLYEVTDLYHPFQANIKPGGCTYDSNTKRLYVSLRADMYGLDPVHVIAVYQLV
jgi:PKD repeat protein